ncbi:hypothetical protein VKT23_011427 [Stygiomarasmius scandens]|uniref:Uncharacterized protein n=1 Tax=Marasmiellus scandens TaxID=2682957 RepID=A0ABR1J9G9_9AGAR
MNFALSSPYHLDLSDSDVKAIALAWPQLCSITLSPIFQPLAVRRRRSRELSLYAVFLFTRLCPNLTTVNLPLNAKVSDTPPFHNNPSSSASQSDEVAQLKYFNMGSSCRVEDGDEHVLPELLGQICAPDCSGFSNWEIIAKEESWDNDAQSKLKAKWDFIKGVFPRFSELYSRLRALENKNKSLQNHMKALGMKAN